MGAKMSKKVYFLCSHVDEFPYNCNDVSDKQRERFPRRIKPMEERF